MNRLNELLADLATELESARMGGNLPGVTRALVRLEAYAADAPSEEATASERQDLARQVAQLQADVKSMARQSSQIASIRRMGSPVRDGQSLRDGRPMMGFRDDADARDFADFCTRLMAGDKKDMSPAGGEEGGYLVPTEQINMEIRRMVMEVGLAARIGYQQPIAAGGGLALHRLGGPTAYWKAAGAAGTPSTPTAGGIRLSPETLMALVNVDMELFEDSRTNLGNYLATEFAYAMGYKEDQAAFIGDGSPTYGGITGILNSDRVTVVLMTTGGDAFGGVNYQELCSVEAELADMGFDNAAWLMHATVLARLKVLIDFAGTPIWQKPSEKEPAELMGYKHHITGFFPRASASAADSRFLAFGNFGQGLLYGTRSRLAIDFSDAARFDYLQRSFRAYERIDIAVAGFTEDERTAHPELRNPIICLATNPAD